MKCKIKEGPDEGWSWVIAAAACFNLTIITGVMRVSGLLLIDFIDEFNVPRETASWPLILYIAVAKMSGVIGGPLANRFGVRPIGILGSIVATVGVAICYCATSLGTITVFFGVIFGVGCGVVYTLMPVVVNQYFFKCRATAMGIALSGASFGTLIFPLIHEHLMSTYGLKGYFLVIGGIVLQVVVFSALLRPPPWLKKSKNTTKETLYNIKILDALNNSVKCKEFFTTTVGFGNQIKNESCSIQLKEKQDPHNNKQIYLDEKSIQNKRLLFNKLNQDMNTKCNSELDTSTKATLYQDANAVTKTKYFSAEKEKQILEKCPILENRSKAFINLQDIQGNDCYETLVPENAKQNTTISVLDNKNVHVCIPANFTRENINASICKNLSDDTANGTKNIYDVYDQSNSPPEPIEKSNHQKFAVRNTSSPSNLRRIHYTTKMDDNFENRNLDTNARNIAAHKDMETPLTMIQSFKVILTSPMFHITTVGHAGLASVLFVHLIIIVDFAIDRGVAKEDAKYILFTYAIADLVSRLGFGWITDSKRIRRPHYIMICMMAITILFFIYPFIYGFPMHACFSCIFGLLSGGTMAVYQILLVDYVGKERQDIGIGFMHFFCGLVMLIWPPIIGYFRDNLGSYSNIFCILGAVAFGTCILWLFEKCFNKEQKVPLNKPHVRNHN